MSFIFIARPVQEAVVMSMLYALVPSGPHVPAYGEIAHAMTIASNNDPLFPHHEAGAEATVCILIAIARTESDFHPNAVGDNGQSLGLYQIQPPTANVDGKLLLVPINASHIAIDLVRTSFRECADRPWFERLAWYISSNTCKNKGRGVLRQSVEKMALATELFAKFFSQSKSDGTKSTIPTELPARGEKVYRLDAGALKR